MDDSVAKPKLIVKQQVASKPKPAKRGRWLRRGFFLLVLISVCGWFAPTILSREEVRNPLTKLLLPDLAGQIHWGQTSLSWISPVVIQDFSVIDEEGTKLIHVGQFLRMSRFGNWSLDWAMIARSKSRTRLCMFR